MPFASLLAALATVRDPRRAQGQRYSMRHLLLSSVLAVLAGATSYRGIVTFIHRPPARAPERRLRRLLPAVPRP
ncbi:MAG: transposase family protein [Geminicoccaceae bacterium]